MLRLHQKKHMAYNDFHQLTAKKHHNFAVQSTRLLILFSLMMCLIVMTLLSMG